jgi:hypothetical protein
MGQDSDQFLALELAPFGVFVAIDPVKLADAMVRLSTEANPPMRFMAGAFAVQSMDTKLASVREELDQWRQLSLSLDYGNS